jgi:hypothetical protein
MTKKQSRSQRWADAVAKAKEGLEALKELQDEYQEWYDNMNENLQGGATGEKLQAITELDIDGAISTVDDCESADLPQGFGRD